MTRRLPSGRKSKLPLTGLSSRIRPKWSVPMCPAMQISPIFSSLVPGGRQREVERHLGVADRHVLDVARHLDVRVGVRLAGRDRRLDGRQQPGLQVRLHRVGGDGLQFHRLQDRRGVVVERRGPVELAVGQDAGRVQRPGDGRPVGAVVDDRPEVPSGGGAVVLGQLQVQRGVRRADPAVVVEHHLGERRHLARRGSPAG